VENAGVLPASQGSLAAMAARRHQPRPGLRDVWVVWGLYGLAAAAIFATYSRVSVGDLYK
jgi:hypothetical protein